VSYNAALHLLKKADGDKRAAKKKKAANKRAKQSRKANRK